MSAVLGEEPRGVANGREGEWARVRTIADGLEWSHGCSAPAAQRLRFLLDFGYATGLRASELVGATLGHVETDARGDHWLRVTGKGKKLARVALPPLAWDALAQYLAGRELPIAPVRWRSETLVIGSLETDSDAAISSARLWGVCSGASSCSPRRPSRRIIRHWQRSCVARVRTGCAAPMRPMHWGAARN
ncbi:integrase [Paraburkholderia youngii]